MSYIRWFDVAVYYIMCMDMFERAEEGFEV